eukprot:5241562-Amphidinium_carterae.1
MSIAFNASMKTSGPTAISGTSGYGSDEALSMTAMDRLQEKVDHMMLSIAELLEGQQSASES